MLINMQLFWYYPSFFFFLYIYTIKFQRQSKFLFFGQAFSIFMKWTKDFLDRLNRL